MTNRTLTTLLLALPVFAIADKVNQPVEPGQVSVFHAVLDDPPLFNGLVGAFDGVYGATPPGLELPSGAMSLANDMASPSAYAVAYSPPLTDNPYINLFNSNVQLPGYQSVMIVGQNPQIPSGAAQPDYRPSYAPPSLDNYGPAPTNPGSNINTWGLQSGGSTGQ